MYIVCNPKIPFRGIYSTRTYLCMCEMTGYTQGLETIQMPISRGLVKQLYEYIMGYQAVIEKKTLTSKLSRDVGRVPTKRK